MFEEKSMLSFNNLDDFSTFCNNLDLMKTWKIEDGTLNHRGMNIEKTDTVLSLRKLFEDKKLFRRNVSIAEIVSWLDSYVIMNRLILELKTMINKDIYSKIKLHSEYKIAMSKNRRIDFIIEYNDKILVCEFRLSDKFPNLSNTWQKKEIELIIYKELLMNYIPQHYKILVFAFIGMPEFSRFGPIHKNMKYNKDNINFLARYIDCFLISNSDFDLDLEERRNENITS